MFCAPGAKNTNESESLLVELQSTSKFSMTKRNITVIKERESTSVESTGAYTEAEIQEDTFKKSSINNTQMNTSQQQRNSTDFNSSANVITLEEVKRRMELQKIPTERFQPEVVENEIQRLLSFFNREF